MTVYKDIVVTVQVQYTVSVRDNESYLNGIEATRRTFLSLEGISNDGFFAKQVPKSFSCLSKEENLKELEHKGEEG